MRILFTGGGTGGHIFPVIAVKRELESIYSSKEEYYYHPPEFEFAGGELKEKEALLKENISIKRVAPAKWRRYFSLQNFLDIFRFPFSLFQALIYVWLFMPDIIFSKGGSGFNNPDDMIYVPLTTAQKQIFGKTNLTSISIEAKSKEIMVQAQDEIGYLLLSEHKLTSPEEADFTIMSQSDLLSTVSQVTGTLTALLGGIAAISLLVGGIGIMNIMLVTVTERTREIGLRKALGAKKKTIITQFLIESILLTFIGGIFGMIFGLTASFVISKIMNLSYVISISSIALAIGVSSLIGIVFGLYPARKAANLQPIEALRYE